MSKPMSEQMQKVAARYEKATGKKFGQMTNAQRIRSMSDEELADYISENCISDFCYIVCGGNCKAMATFNKTSHQVCREIVADWLKQPYSGGDA